MPAIHPPKLQQQVSELVQNYADPEKFLRKLQDLFAFYGDQTKRVSPRSMKTTGLPSAHVPKPVLRQVMLQLTPYAENIPHAVLVLARSLWEQPQLEHRELATLLLGKLPLNYSNEVLSLVPKWCLQNHEESILISLATNSLEKIQKEDPDQLLGHIERWLYPEPESSEEVSPQAQKPTPAAELNMHKLAITALVPLANAPSFVNLPKVYNLLKPKLAEAPNTLRPYLLDLLRPLARRSPQEITYILRTELSQTPANKHLIWLARRTMDELPAEQQAKLKSLIYPQQSKG
jgi:hypothetical protein